MGYCGGSSEGQKADRNENHAHEDSKGTEDSLRSWNGGNSCVFQQRACPHVPMPEEPWEAELKVRN